MRLGSGGWARLGSARVGLLGSEIEGRSGRLGLAQQAGSDRAAHTGGKERHGQRERRAGGKRKKKKRPGGRKERGERRVWAGLKEETAREGFVILKCFSFMLLNQKGVSILF